MTELLVIFFRGIIFPKEINIPWSRMFTFIPVFSKFPRPKEGKAEHLKLRPPLQMMGLSPLLQYYIVGSGYSS